MNEEKKGPSKLSDLLEDLQSTLEDSLYSEAEKTPPQKTKEPQKPKEPDIFELPEIYEPEPPKPPPKKAQPPKPPAEKETKDTKPEQGEKGPKGVLWEVQKDDAYATEQSDMDLELLKAIGIGREEPPGRTAPTGKAVVEKSGHEHEKKPAIKKPPPKTYYRASEKEFVDRDQINGIFESYRSGYVSAIFRLAAGVALFLILFYMETAPYMKWKMPGIFNIYYYNMPYIWMDMQLLVLVAAINRKSLAYGVKSMFSSNINVYSISFFFVAVSFVHTVLTLYLRYNNPEMALYNSVAVFSMVMAALYNLMDINAEIDSFKAVSSTKPKYALTLADGSKPPKTAGTKEQVPYASAKQDAELFRDVAFGSTVGGVVKTPFVSNFFLRTYRNKHPGGLIKYYIYISVFAALAIFIVTMGIKHEKDWYISLSSVAALMLGSVPLCAFVAGSYPAFKAQKKARQIGAAFVGGEIMEESSGTPIISVYDRDIFPAKQVRISGMKVSKHARIETVMQNLCAILDKLGMPPAEIFKTSANYDASAERDIKVIGVDDEGVCFSVSGKKLFIGRVGYISNLGLDPYGAFSSDVDDAFVKSLGSIMFLSSETELMAKVYIAYELTPDYYDVIQSLKKINACLCIRTFDPNIDEELVVALGGTKKYPVRVLKLKDTADVHQIPEQADAPVVSKESLKSLMGAVVIADKIKTLIKTNVFLQIIAFAAGILLSAILCIAGQLWGINAGHLILFQSFWMLPIVVLLGLN